MRSLLTSRKHVALALALCAAASSAGGCRRSRSNELEHVTVQEVDQNGKTPPTTIANAARNQLRAPPARSGITECDSWAALVCTCSDAHYRDQRCAGMHELASKWRVMVEPERTRTAQGCRQGLIAARNFCH